MRTTEQSRYLQSEAHDTQAVVDFMGPYPVTVKIQLDEKGELWIEATSATQDAPILINETAQVPEADEED